MSENDAEKTGLQSGNEADVSEPTEIVPKKRHKRSKEFRENTITDSETAKARGSKGGVKSGEVRRENAQRKKDAREAAQFLFYIKIKNIIVKIN